MFRQNRHTSSKWSSLFAWPPRDNSGDQLDENPLHGQFRDADGGGVHGLNERLSVKSLYEGEEFLYRLVETLSSPQ